MKESAIVSRIIKKVKEKYPMAYVRKLSDRFTRGILDVLIVVKTKVVIYEQYHCTLFVEVKTATGETSALQGKEILDIQQAGGEVLVARDVETVLAKLEEMGAI